MNNDHKKTVPGVSITSATKQHSYQSNWLTAMQQQMHNKYILEKIICLGPVAASQVQLYRLDISVTVVNTAANSYQIYIEDIKHVFKTPASVGSISSATMWDKGVTLVDGTAADSYQIYIGKKKIPARWQHH